MYFYIFDPRGEREVKYFERIQGRLLNTLAETHIEGETYRVTAIRSIELLVEQAIGAEVRTIIVVGSDSSLNKTINALVRKKADVTVGFISLDEASSLGHIFGVTADIQDAVRTLAGRLVRELDLGQIGEHYFLSKVDLGENYFSRTDAGFLGVGSAMRFMSLRPFPIQISLDGRFNVTTEALGAQIINSRSNKGCRIKLGNPQDKLLDILILGKLTTAQIFRYRKELASGCLDNVPGATILHAKKVEIIGPKKLPLAVEGQVYTKAPATVIASKEKIKMIVGKARQF